MVCQSARGPQTSDADSPMSSDVVGVMLMKSKTAAAAAAVTSEAASVPPAHTSAVRESMHNNSVP